MVSIIIATYRRLDYLKQTVASILDQTYSDFEIIIVADGHEQDAEDYVSNLGANNVSYYAVEHCGYPAKPRNFGVEKAKGEYIAFCDDDDLWEKEKLEMQVAIMQNNLQIAFCCTNRSVINQNGEKIKERALRKPKYLGLFSLLLSNYVTTSSVIVRKTILEKTGLFPDTPKFYVGEDYHLWIRVIRYGKNLLIDKSLVGYRIHTGNITPQFSRGAKGTLLVLRDVFSHNRIPFVYRYVAIMVAWLKFCYYKIRE